MRRIENQGTRISGDKEICNQETTKMIGRWGDAKIEGRGQQNFGMQIVELIKTGKMERG